MHQPQGDHLTGPEAGLGMCGEACQRVIDPTEEGRDTIDGGSHRLLRAWQGCTLSPSLEEVHDYDNKAVQYYWIYWFVRD